MIQRICCVASCKFPFFSHALQTWEEGLPGIETIIWFAMSSIDWWGNLRENFLEELDDISPNMIGLFKRKTGAIGQRLNELLQQTKTTEPTDIRCLILRGLPVVLGDDPAAFFKTCSDATDQEVFSQTSVAILCIDSEHPQLNPSRVGIILEGTVVMDELDNLLFGLIIDLTLQHWPSVTEVPINQKRGVLEYTAVKRLPPPLR
ncbi:uncharacterized protein LOC121720065 [Alosa sapidissima]|uniref:uncharacterized protein LOC121720065 n=1 Tax=Alosa sapidissima TaxID=34773 RepID=UPI001C093587|nr:uncharacterized protein LOC121720065 [Alosa sapidissima]